MSTVGSVDNFDVMQDLSSEEKEFILKMARKSPIVRSAWDVAQCFDSSERLGKFTCVLAQNLAILDSNSIPD